MAQQTVEETIEKAAVEGVATVSVDGTSVSAIPLRDLIAADNYLRQRAAIARNHLGLTFRKLEPGGCG